MGLFNRFVEIGRIVLINYGPESGKLACIIDVVDGNKVLIDGPTFGVERQIINLRRIQLTDIKVQIPRNAREKTLKAAFAKVDVVGKWSATSWAKKIAIKKARAATSDFDRFKIMIARKQKASLIKAQM